MTARWRVEIRAGNLVGYGTPPPLPSVELLWAAHRRREKEQARRADYRKEWGMAPPTGSAAYPLHVRFARLHGSPDEELRRFAQRFGLLGIVEETAAAYIEALRRAAAVLAAQEHETLADVERRYQADRARVETQALEEALRRVGSQDTPRPFCGPREPLAEWRREIARVWALVRLHEAGTRLARGELVGFEEVREALGVLGADGMVGWWDALAALDRGQRAAPVKALIAEAINARGPIQYRVALSGGELVQVPVARTLLDAIYASLALALDGGPPARFCKACGRPFVPTRADQEYCPPEPGKRVSRCSNRARQRALRNRRRQGHA